EVRDALAGGIVGGQGECLGLEAIRVSAREPDDVGRAVGGVGVNAGLETLLGSLLQIGDDLGRGEDEDHCVRVQVLHLEHYRGVVGGVELHRNVVDIGRGVGGL